MKEYLGSITALQHSRSQILKYSSLRFRKLTKGIKRDVSHILGDAIYYSTAYKQRQGMDNTNQEVKVGNKENQATRTPEIQ